MKFELQTFLKSVIYRLFASNITFGIAFLFTRKLSISFGIGVLEFIGKIFGYYVFEILWKNIMLFIKAKAYREKCFTFEKNGKIILLSGLNCSGKTSIAKEMISHMKNTILLDGDAIRSSINYDLGFTDHDIRVNLQKTSNLAKTLRDQGFNVIIACISKRKCDRQFIKQNIGNDYIEVHVHCNNRTLKHRQSLLHKQTKVIQANYEKSDYDVIEVDTSKMSIEECALKILKKI